MEVILILGGLLIVVGGGLWLHHLLYYGRKDASDGIQSDETSEGAEAAEGECCGMHQVCEKLNHNLLNTDIEYFDDEELDAFAGREAGNYTPKEEEMFRDVMLTLPKNEYALWSASLQKRNISLPENVREEFLMLLSENS